MSYRGPFHLSSFVHDDEATGKGVGSRQDTHPPPASDARPRSASRGSSSSSSDDDGYGPVEVFYDQHSGMSAWEKKRQPSTHTTAAASTQQKSKSTTTEHPNQRVTHGGRVSRATVRQYTGVVNAAVATMDHAVSIPSALRGAARRTLLDVLVDVKRRSKAEVKKREKETEEEEAAQHVASRVSPSKGVAATQEGSSHVEQHPQQNAKATPAVTFTRDVTYRMLFPTTAVTTRLAQPAAPHVPSSPSSAKQQQQEEDAHGQGKQDSLTVHRTTSLPQSGSSGSRTTLGTIAADSQKARVNEPHCEQGCPAPSSVSGSKASHSPFKDAQVQPVNSSVAALQNGPDRRLRHLLPAHLRAARLDSSKATQDPTDNNNEDDDSISDVSSTSTEAERRTEHPTAAMARRRASKKDDCLLDILEGGRRSDTKRNSSAVEMNWLQKMEADESRGLPMQPQQRAGMNHSNESSTVDQRMLEEVLMGHNPSRRPSTSEKRDAHRHRRHRHTSRSQTSNSNTTVEASASRSKSRNRSSRSSSTRSRSSTSVDLMRDIDDDVPQWVRQHEARQQLLQHQLSPYGLESFAASTALTGKPNAEMERERAAAVKPFIGKPATFYPSCAASRRSQQSNNGKGAAGQLSQFQRLSNASGFFASATKAASRFLTGWKEGKRLLKQNSTAMAVVEYLGACFERWKPYGPHLQTESCGRASLSAVGATGEESSSVDVSISSADDPPASSNVKAEQQQQQQQQQKDMQSNNAEETGSTTVAEQKECGVELKIRVQYVEAAFNVAVVRGTLVWCSDDARKRLHLSLSTDATTSTAQGSTVRPGEANEEEGGTAVAGHPSNVLCCVSAEEDGRPWSFLFPEPALMQLTMAVGEHLYVAQPYYVYADTRVVLATYNFTSDAVVRQQEVQYALELEERLRAVAVLNEERENKAAHAHSGGIAAEAAQPRHRGLSPVRGPAVPRTSQSDRSPTELGRPSNTILATPTTITAAAAVVVPDRSPNRMVYEIPGYSRTPQRAAQTVINSTPERARSVPMVDGTSPEPHCPSASLHGDPVAGSGVLHERDMADEIDPHPYTSVRPNTTVSPLPSYVRPSTISVNSLAADGFYDPLAMPAFPTTTTAVGATTAGVGGNVTVVLTGSSDDADGEGRWAGQHYETEQPSLQSDGAAKDPKRRWWPGGAAGGGTADAPEDGLRPPPPLQPLLDATTTVHDDRIFTSQREKTAADGTTGEPVRTFGSAEAVVEDSVGHGFPRGPSPSWDVPVEVLFALSGVTNQRASKVVAEPRSSAEAQQETRSEAVCHPTPSQIVDDAASRRRKRGRDGGGSADTKRGAPFVDVHNRADAPPSQVEASQNDRFHNEGAITCELPDVSYSFPTPSPSLTQQPSQREPPARQGGSLSYSISSPSDLSDDASDHDAPSSKNLPLGTAAPPAPRITCRGRANATKQTARQQEEWMRRLWQQQQLPAVPPAQAPTTSTATRIDNAARDPFVSLSRLERQPTERNATTASPLARETEAGDVNGSGMSLPPQSQMSTRQVGVYGSIVSPHEAEAEATAQTTGFYALNDVILSDSDE